LHVRLSLELFVVMKDRQQVVKIIAFFAGFIIAAGLIAAIPKSWYLQAGGVETDLLSDYVDQKNSICYFG